MVGCLEAVDETIDEMISNFEMAVVDDRESDILNRLLFWQCVGSHCQMIEHVLSCLLLSSLACCGIQQACPQNKADCDDGNEEQSSPLQHAMFATCGV